MSPSLKTDAGLKKDTNEVAATENWRAACSKEQKLANCFDETWGFLKVPGEATSHTRPHQSHSVKYINPKGGTWTVVAQRIPLAASPGTTAAVPDGGSLKSTTHLSAFQAADLTHSRRLDYIGLHNSLFRTTNERYGQRLPLEQFGTARRTDAPPYLDPYNLMVEEAVSA
eukprot:jgi/Astpho2/8700/Aster-x1538